MKRDSVQRLVNAVYRFLYSPPDDGLLTELIEAYDEIEGNLPHGVIEPEKWFAGEFREP